MDVSSHGEENPLVKTADNVANAENRRVEVIVR
jgi:outer membrane protein OmpA-like peptidoglycan-associated protein